MFGIFRFFIVFLSLATLILSVFALIGSYKNESYLTQNYLINFHLTHLNLSTLIDTADLKKRTDYEDEAKFFELENNKVLKRDYMEKDASVVLSSRSIASLLESELGSISASDIGLGDVYSISFWGYCKGNVTSSESKESDYFDNNHVDYTYCTNPKLGYRFDPLTIFKKEIKSVASSVSSTLETVIDAILDNVTYESLNLPGDLKKKITLIQNITIAGSAFILAGAILSFITLVFQIFACCVDPLNFCLSCISFIFQAFTFVVVLVGSALTTGLYMYVRKQVNNDEDTYGVRSFLSVQFYAFSWSAVVAALLVVVISLVGHCCGAFETRRWRSPYPRKY